MQQSFVQHISKQVIDFKKLNILIEDTKNGGVSFPEQTHVIKINDHFHMLYNIYPNDHYQKEKFNEQKEYKLSSLCIIYINKDKSFDVIVHGMKEDTHFKDPHKFANEAADMFKYIYESNNFILLTKHKNESISKFSRFCIKKEREING